MSTALLPILDSLLKALPPRPLDQSKLNELVEDAITQSKDKTFAGNWKSQWEYSLKNEIFILAATEGKALKDDSVAYYDELNDRLDVVLTFTEHDACEQTFPFIVLQDLLETQTITSCSHIFSWIEARATRLTEGMIPQKGKALILLRTLNDLLRRLSKMGSTTIFCGRILTFLSGVFPLGERSGVNLRGEYGPTWEGVGDPGKRKVDGKTEEAKDEVMDTSPDVPSADAKGEDKQSSDTKDVKKLSEIQEKKEEFYTTFWSLQLPFSKPPLFALPGTFPQFRDAVNKVLPVIKEATAKERAMMGSRAGAGSASLKRKRDVEPNETSFNEYFFAKFLTSPDLLDLEIADTHFRRQFLFQLLILLNHLLTFTKAAKSTWSTPRNRSLQMDFTLEATEQQWVQDTIIKATEELRQTAPSGRAFAETVNVILEREKNWVKWKNELCAPFDKEPWSVELEGKKAGLFEATIDVRTGMRLPPPEWEWRLGTEPLTDIWDMGCRGLEDLQTPFQPGDVKDYVKKVRQEDARIEMRRKTLARTAERIALARAKVAAPATPAAQPVEASTKMDTSPDKVSEKLPATETQPIPSSSQPAQTTLTESSIHPSLPAKPGTAPTKPSNLPPETNKNGAPTSSSTPNVTSTSLPVPAPVPAPVEPVPLPTDDQILKFEENKQRWAWLALRTARDQYLQHFGKIGTGDIEMLAKEIELEKEKMQKNEEATGGVAGTTEEQAVGSPTTTTVPVPSAGPEDVNQDKDNEPPPKAEGEVDVKMEDG